MSKDSKEKRVHDLLYSCADREEICRRVVDLEDLVTKSYKVLERAHWQPSGFLTHGGIKSADMASIYEDMRRLGLLEIGMEYGEGSHD